MGNYSPVLSWGRPSEECQRSISGQFFQKQKEPNGVKLEGNCQYCEDQLICNELLDTIVITKLCELDYMADINFK